jgi:hypothetical protein
MILPAVIYQAANLHPAPAAHRSSRSGSQIPSSIVMPGFVAPGFVAAFRT